ncbi:T6SS immunity protein Tli4 family protein [Dyella acidiphila]|uniref:Tle cognate immunity protein 4 C-terminal domain-containing protein n=1 Tax=Dyella acidiphila TaxID=2775866 RepID=A0ABR9GAM7_9GAMM|nr:T6SS immunity protein Tli4 family protein [Dyella acidiphila]MBE1161090.1 hypothetical protein [Dyella acidiphila]
MIRTLRCLFVALLLAVAASAVAAQGDAPVTEHGSRSICAGRFAIDLPADAEVAINATYRNAQLSGATAVRNLDAWKSSLGTKAKQLSSSPMVKNDYKDQILKSAGVNPGDLYGKTQLVDYETDDSLQRAWLAYQPDPAKPDLRVEVHKLIHGMDYMFVAKGLGANAYPRVKSDLLTAVGQFQPIGKYEAPNQPGFCVNGGVYLDPGHMPVNERLTLVVTFPKRPDLQFTIDTNAIDQVNKGEPPLKDRVDSDLNVMRANYAGVSVMARGELQAAGQQGYQIGVSAPYDLAPGTHIRKFFWSADGVPNDVTRPFMEVDFTIQPTDDGKSTVKDDAEAKELWDQLIAAIHIRPGAKGTL